MAAAAVAVDFFSAVFLATSFGVDVFFEPLATGALIFGFADLATEAATERVGWDLAAAAALPGLPAAALVGCAVADARRAAPDFATGFLRAVAAGTEALLVAAAFAAGLAAGLVALLGAFLGAAAFFAAVAGLVDAAFFVAAVLLDFAVAAVFEAAFRAGAFAAGFTALAAVVARPAAFDFEAVDFAVLTVLAFEVAAFEVLVVAALVFLAVVFDPVALDVALAFALVV